MGGKESRNYERDNMILTLEVKLVLCLDTIAERDKGIY